MPQTKTAIEGFALANWKNAGCGGDSTVALTALLRARGAHVLRVHDVLPNANALRTAEAVLAATR